MKIIYCIPSCHNSGGMERVLSVKANYLADVVGWDISVITTEPVSQNNHYQFSSKIHFYNLDIHYKEIENISLWKKTIMVLKKKLQHKKKLQELLFHLKPDIVVSMFTHDVSFLYKIKDGSKKVCELHFSKKFRKLHNESNHAGIANRMISYYLDHRDFKAASHYDRFVVLTEEDQKTWYPLKNIKVIYNPLPFIAEQTANIHTKKVLAIGRLCPQKGFDMLVDIWNVVCKNIEGWELNIYGDGPDYAALDSKIKQYSLHKTIHMYPATTNIQSVYLNSSIFCFPSRYEGFSMALMEAMSYGLPAIAFKCPCGPSEIIENGINGILVENKNINDFAYELQKLMKDEKLREEYGIRAAMETKYKFNIDHIMKQWVSLFNDLKS